MLEWMAGAEGLAAQGVREEAPQVARDLWEEVGLGEAAAEAVEAASGSCCRRCCRGEPRWRRTCCIRSGRCGGTCCRRE